MQTLAGKIVDAVFEMVRYDDYNEEMELDRIQAVHRVVGLMKADDVTPDLLAALKAIERSHGTYSNGNYVGCQCGSCVMARFAIAKAERG